jgi:hypothetical protein
MKLDASEATSSARPRISAGSHIRPGGSGAGRASRAGRTPLRLFGDYLAEQNVTDPRVERMFAELLEQIADGGAVPPQ